MKAAEWIDRMKSVKGIASDYAAAKALGISRNTVSQYRTRPATLDEAVAIRLAKEIGLRPEGVMLDQAAERVKDDSVRSALLREAERLCIMSSRARSKSKAATVAQIRAALSRRYASQALHH